MTCSARAWKAPCTALSECRAAGAAAPTPVKMGLSAATDRTDHGSRPTYGGSHEQIDDPSGLRRRPARRAAQRLLCRAARFRTGRQAGGAHGGTERRSRKSTGGGGGGAEETPRPPPPPPALPLLFPPGHETAGTRRARRSNGAS